MNILACLIATDICNIRPQTSERQSESWVNFLFKTLCWAHVSFGGKLKKRLWRMWNWLKSEKQVNHHDAMRSAREPEMQSIFCLFYDAIEPTICSRLWNPIVNASILATVKRIKVHTTTWLLSIERNLQLANQFSRRYNSRLIESIANDLFYNLENKPENDVSIAKIMASLKWMIKQTVESNSHEKTFYQNA